MLNRTSRAVSAEVINAGKCNLSCEYCYIPKTSAMNELHDDIVRHIESGKFIDRLYELYGEGLEHITLWGTEPTLTLELFTKHMPNILERFPKLASVGFSSNFIHKPRKLLEFVESLPKDKKDFIFRVQYSLDGPSYVNDKTRGLKNATTTIINNVLQFAKEVSRMELGLLNVKLVSKSTWDEDTIEFYHSNKNELDEFYAFFNTLFLQIEDVTNPTTGFEHIKANTPTFAVPGKYLTKHGLMVGNLTDRIFKLEDEDKYPFLNKMYHSYYARFLRMMTYLDEYLTKPEMFTCSAGDSQFGVDHSGNIHACHRTFYVTDDRYVDSVKENTKLGNWHTEHYKSDRLKVIRNGIVNIEDSNYDKTKMLYSFSGYHNFAIHRIVSSIALCRWMSLVGQVSADYAKDDRLTDIAMSYLTSAFSCPVENSIGLGSKYVLPTSIIRLTCNGMFELILRRYYELHRRER